MSEKEKKHTNEDSSGIACSGVLLIMCLLISLPVKHIKHKLLSLCVLRNRSRRWHFRWLVRRLQLATRMAQSKSGKVSRCQRLCMIDKLPCVRHCSRLFSLRLLLMVKRWHCFSLVDTDFRWHFCVALSSRQEECADRRRLRHPVTIWILPRWALCWSENWSFWFLFHGKC